MADADSKGGTPVYASPECFGETVTKSDVFSFGRLILFLLLTKEQFMKWLYIPIKNQARILFRNSLLIISRVFDDPQTRRIQRTYRIWLQKILVHLFNWFQKWLELTDLTESIWNQREPNSMNSEPVSKSNFQSILPVLLMVSLWIIWRPKWTNMLMTWVQSGKTRVRNHEKNSALFSCTINSALFLHYCTIHSQ